MLMAAQFMILSVKPCVVGHGIGTLCTLICAARFCLHQPPSCLIPCPALPCPALPGPALPCPDLPCPDLLLFQALHERSRTGAAEMMIRTIVQSWQCVYTSPGTAGYE